jgi:hypothetical protein
MWCPKVTKANNDIQCSKVAKSNNAIVNVFYTFNFLVVNPTNHNNQQVFHLDFTFVCWTYLNHNFPPLWNRVMLEFPTFPRFSSLAIFFLISIMIFAHLIKRNQVNTTFFEWSFSKHNDTLLIIWFFILISSMHHLHLEPLVTHVIK